MEMPPTKRTKGGVVRIVDSSTFKAATDVAMAMVTVHLGGLRELHWHPNVDEWQYYIVGKGRMTVVSTGNRARTMDFQAGDVGYVEKNPVALHREYRGYRPDLFGNVQKRLLSRLVAFRVVGPHPTGAGDGTSQYRPGDAGRNSERRASDRAALVGCALRRATSCPRSAFRGNRAVEFFGRHFATGELFIDRQNLEVLRITISLGGSSN